MLQTGHPRSHIDIGHSDALCTLHRAAPLPCLPSGCCRPAARLCTSGRFREKIWMNGSLAFLVMLSSRKSAGSFWPAGAYSKDSQMPSACQAFIV